MTNFTKCDILFIEKLRKKKIFLSKWALGLQGVVTCFANRKTDGFDSHKVHQWDIKCVITLAAGYLVASLKSPINRALTQLVSVTDS